MVLDVEPHEFIRSPVFLGGCRSPSHDASALRRQSLPVLDVTSSEALLLARQLYMDFQEVKSIMPPGARRSLGETWKNTKLPNWLVVTGTWMDYDFPYIGNFIIPTDFHIFERGWNHQPAKSWENNRHIEGTNMRSDDLYLSVLRQFGGISDTADWWFPP